MTLRIILTAIIAAAVAASAPARRYAKPGATRAAAAPHETVPEAVFDTVAADTSRIQVAGFEKTLASTRETMFIVNGLDRPVEGLALDIVYSDMSGRMLHSASHTVAAHIPAGESRMVSVPSFDRQKVFYYHLSPAPTRARVATPFKVQVTVTSVFHPTEQ